MHGILLTIHIVICALLVLIVLIQSGRSGGFSGLFGGGGGDALFSTSGQQSGLRNATVVIAILFFLTSLGLTMLSSRQGIQTVFNRALPAVPPINLPPAETAPTMPTAESNFKTETKTQPKAPVGMPNVPNHPAPASDKK